MCLFLGPDNEAQAYEANRVSKFYPLRDFEPNLNTVHGKEHIIFAKCFFLQVFYNSSVFWNFKNNKTHQIGGVLMRDNYEHSSNISIHALSLSVKGRDHTEKKQRSSIKI